MARSGVSLTTLRRLMPDRTDRAQVADGFFHDQQHINIGAVESRLLSPRQWVRLQAQWEGRRVNPGTLYYSPQAIGVVGKALSTFVA